MDTGMVSIVLYFSVYIIAFILFRVAEKLRGTRFLIAVICANLILASFAGMRNLTVGTDTQNTIDNAYFYIGWDTIFTEKNISRGILISVIGCLLKTIGLSESFFLFVIQLLILIPIEIVLFMRKDKSSPSFGMLIYLLLFFQLSFNWIKQSISASFMLLSVALLITKSNRKAVFCAVTSLLFHPSSVIGFLIYSIGLFCQKSQGKARSIIVGTLTVIVFSLAGSHWSTIGYWLIERGLLPGKYLDYIDIFSGNASSAVMSRHTEWFAIGSKIRIEMIIRIILFLFSTYAIARKRQVSTEKHFEEKYYVFVCAISISMYIFGIIILHTAYINRITYYSDMLLIILLGTAWRKPVTNKRTTVPVTNLLIVILSGTYNIWLYYVLGWHATLPYILR